MKKSKIKNIVIDKISKKTFGGSQNELLISRVVDETLKAINYTRCCKSDSELLQKLEMVKNFKWGIDARDNERRMCELIQLL